MYQLSRRRKRYLKKNNQQLRSKDLVDLSLLLLLFFGYSTFSMFSQTLGTISFLLLGAWWYLVTIWIDKEKSKNIQLLREERDLYFDTIMELEHKIKLLKDMDHTAKITGMQKDQ
jgi:hypothetical protein